MRRYTQAEILRCYHRLYNEHPHALLPLETALPADLQHPARDRYRTVLTMILSVRMADTRLTQALGKLFASYPDFHSLQGLSKPQLHTVLRQAGVVLNNPDYTGNGGRLWEFLQLYFGPWLEHITAPHIQTLLAPKVRGFGDKIVRLLQAYCFGNTRVLPLDTPAFNAVRACGLYQDWKITDIRRDLEEKLAGVQHIALVDVHELLRFRGQAGRVEPHYLTRQQQQIIIGWNAWRLLIAPQSTPLSQAWLHQHLVQHETLATALSDYLHVIWQPAKTP
jgi:endonuclease III